MYNVIIIGAVPLLAFPQSGILVIGVCGTMEFGKCREFML